MLPARLVLMLARVSSSCRSTPLRCFSSPSVAFQRHPVLRTHLPSLRHGTPFNLLLQTAQRPTFSRRLSSTAAMQQAQGDSSTTATAAGKDTAQYKADRTSLFSETVWVEFTPLAKKHNAVNLSQGVPSIPVDPLLTSALQEASTSGVHQYTRVGGHPRLVDAIAAHYSPEFGRNIDPLSNICITTGATQGLLLFFQTFINPGDEVIIFEPFYDSYIPQIGICGGVPVTVPLRLDKSSNPKSQPDITTSADWTFSEEDLAAAFSDKTKAILVNTPHNPTGKVFTKDELCFIGELAKKHDALILADQVYEKIVYEGNMHQHVGSLNDYWERTVSLGSAGKAFNVTGWKIGWAIGPKHLIQPLQTTQQYVPFCVSSILQEALAIAFEKAPEAGFFEKQLEEFDKKRHNLYDYVQACGLEATLPDSAYFILANTEGVHFEKMAQGFTQKAPFRRDYDFCRWLTTEVGVAAIPPSCFYTDANASLAENFARFHDRNEASDPSPSSYSS